MEKRTSESYLWSLDEMTTAVYVDTFFSDVSDSRSSQSVALVSSDAELLGMITTQNKDFSTYRAYGAFTDAEFLERTVKDLVSPLSQWGQRIIYYARNQLD